MTVFSRNMRNSSEKLRAEVETRKATEYPPRIYSLKLHKLIELRREREVFKLSVNVPRESMKSNL